MTKYIGRLVNFGIGKEASRGQGNEFEVTHYIRKTDMDFEDKVEYSLEEGSVGQILDSADNYSVKRWAEGTVGGTIFANSFGILLQNLLGTSDVPVSRPDGTFLHNFTINNINQHPSLIIGVNEPNQSLVYKLAMLNTLNITANAGEKVTFSGNFKSKKQSLGMMLTPTYTDDIPMLAKHGAFRVGPENDRTALALTLPIPIKSFVIDFNKNLEDDYALGVDEPIDILNTKIEISGTIEFDFDNTTFKDYVMNGGKKSFSMYFSQVVAGKQYDLSVLFDSISLYDWAKNNDNDTIVTQTVSFKVHSNLKDLTKNGMVTIGNTTASY